MTAIVRLQARCQKSACIVAAVCAMASVGSAADPIEMHRYTIDGGGGEANGGGFELSGTLGQPDAGVMAGGSFTLTGGFWFGPSPGDCDADGDVDLRDFEAFEACMTGPVGTLAGDCLCHDLDRDGAIDLNDFSVFAAQYTGP